MDLTNEMESIELVSPGTCVVMVLGVEIVIGAGAGELIVIVASLTEAALTGGP